MERFNAPPPPSTPERAPWEDVQRLVQRLDRLIGLLEGAVTPGGIPGGPESIAQLVVLLQELAPEVLGNSAVIPFQKTVSTAYQDEQERQVPFNGVVRDVVMAFPAGCQQLVEVRLLYLPKGGSYEFIIPTVDGSFVALDDFTTLFQPRFPIKAPGNLKVEWYNYDSLNTHSVPVIATVTPSRLGVKT